MGGWISFKGIRNTDLGCKIEAMPPECAPKRRVVPEPIPGRSGVLHIDEGAYDPVTMSATFNLANAADERKIMAWLDGYGDLILSDSPTYRRKASVIDGMAPFKRRHLNNGERHDTFTVKFQCDPFLYESDPTITLLNGPYTFANPGTVPADPLITVQGTGSVTLYVGDISVTLDDLAGEVTIDCDAKEAYKGASKAPTAITLNDEKWPVLGLGDTEVRWTGNAGVTVRPNWRWL